jgi:hypothetical protein
MLLLIFIISFAFFSGAHGVQFIDLAEVNRGTTTEYTFGIHAQPVMRLADLHVQGLLATTPTSTATAFPSLEQCCAMVM